MFSDLREEEKYRLQEEIDRLREENKDLKKQIESQKGLITVGGKQQYEYLQRIDELEQENKELKEKIKKYSAINEQDTKDYAILRNALEEIRNCINVYCTVDNDFINSETYLRIKDELEVLGNENN